jgi:predicted AAA+ superfamily ATPase
LFYYRDQDGVEIDFVVEKNQQIMLIEAKLAEHVDASVDASKLNFKKVLPLFQKNLTADCIGAFRCYVAAKINEKNWCCSIF